MAHLAAVELSVELWQDFCTVGTKHGAFEVIEGLPEGAEFIRSWVDGPRGVVVMAFYHPSFKDVRLGEDVPRIGVILHAIYDREHSV
jgi:hypothetical protein